MSVVNDMVQKIAARIIEEAFEMRRLSMRDATTTRILEALK